MEIDYVKKIKINKIRCKKCGNVIESTHRHDFKFCKCGAVAVDGGKDYLHRCGKHEDWEELSELSDRHQQTEVCHFLPTKAIDFVPNIAICKLFSPLIFYVSICSRAWGG